MEMRHGAYAPMQACPPSHGCFAFPAGVCKLRKCKLNAADCTALEENLWMHK